MPRVSQVPDRSGLPSGVLGAGASRLTLPSALRGTPGCLTPTHCAEAVELIAIAATTAAIPIRFTLIVLLLNLHTRIEERPAPAPEPFLPFLVKAGQLRAEWPRIDVVEHQPAGRE